MKKLVHCWLLLVFLLPVMASAAVLDVPGDYTTISEAVNAAFDGDTIRLADGTYSSPDDYNVDFNSRSLTVESASGDPNSCIIDCQQNGRAFLALNYENITLKGLTIKNGEAGSSSGGGLYFDTATLVASNCIFEGNHAQNGGAVYIVNPSSSCTFSNCSFSTNTSERDGGAVYAASTAFGDCSFDGNSGGNYGGAVYSVNKSSFANCAVSAGTAPLMVARFITSILNLPILQFPAGRHLLTAYFPATVLPLMPVQYLIVILIKHRMPPFLPP